ncbi:MAG: SHOCT domain-containing protein [Chloroflexi bacterium]|nr:SHOCT domain-containing protein [Chloroflexota bacterium]
MWKSRIIISFCVALFLAFMFGAVVPAIFPNVAKIAAPVLCHDSEKMTVTSKTYNPEPGRTVTSREWFCVDQGGTVRSLGILPPVVCVALAFPPLFILMLIFIKPIMAATQTSAYAGSKAVHQRSTPSQNSKSFAMRLEELRQARDAGLITEEEFETKKQAMLKAL